MASSFVGSYIHYLPWKKRIFASVNNKCPPMKESNTQKELSRVPRTLSEASNTKVLEALFDAGGTVMSDIIIYVASSQMKAQKE